MLRFPLALLFLALPAFAAEPSPFKAGKHDKGELKFVGDIPVLTLKGSPEAIGDQIGVLVGKNSPDPTPILLDFLKEVKLGGTLDVLKVFSRKLQPGFPAHHLKEIEALSKTSGYDLDLFLFINTVYDLSSGMGCSTFVLEKERSATGSPIFGRNFDWVPSKGLPQQSMVMVFQPEGKRAHAIVTLAPITGSISGMNDAGLCLTINAIALKKSKDKAEFDWNGTPTLLLFRQVLEECKSIDEAKAFLEKSKRTTAASMTLCDETGGAVLEITPKSVEIRKPDHGAVCCTNHFVSEALGLPKQCWRLDKLEAQQKKDDKFGVKDVFDVLHEVNQGKATVHSMVFEPKERKIHLKFGDGAESATKQKATEIDLGKLFK